MQHPQDVNARTIDEVIGSNLRHLRSAESMTLANAAETIGWLAGESFSEAKLSRWETGHYHFTMDDLFLMSQVYGVHLISLLTPVDPTITHIRFLDNLYPVERYRYDFFIDPQGAFADRATDIAERNRHGVYDVAAALDDLRERLGDKARLADLHSTLQGLGWIASGEDPPVKLAKELDARIAAGPQPGDQSAEVGELVRRRLREKREAREGTDDGVTQEDE